MKTPETTQVTTLAKIQETTPTQDSTQATTFDMLAVLKTTESPLFSQSLPLSQTRM